MASYTIKSYEPGFEEQQAKIGEEVAKNWAWPFHYPLEELKDIYSQPSFDPETLLSCFKDGKMVGFALVKLLGEGPGVIISEGMTAYLDIPWVLPSHKKAADLLMERVIEVLKDKGAKSIRMRVSTMRENSIQLVEKWGFKPVKDYELGYKIYYTYDLSKGKINYPAGDVEKFNPVHDLEESIPGVSREFKISKERARKWILDTDTREDLVSHLVIRKNGKLVGYCNAFPHPENKGIVAANCIEAANEEYLKQLIVQMINDCIDRNHGSFLVDVINDLLKYETAVISLGFDNAATWGIYEKSLTI